MTEASAPKRKSGFLTALIVVLLMSFCLVLSYKIWLRKLDFVQEMKGKNTIASIVAAYGQSSRARLRGEFERRGLNYPPAGVIMLGLKYEKLLQIYALDQDGKYKFVCSYPIIGNSGVLGPKQKEGDKQMPEGFYRIRELEPNSQYHVALRVDYPSDFDKEMGARDGRTNLGSDIMIHGKDQSVGCLAMGDSVSEDLFVLVNDVGLDKTELIMSPYDFRKPPLEVALPDKPSWVGDLYERLEKALCELP